MADVRSVARSARFRATAQATIIIAAFLVAGAWVLLSLLAGSLRQSVDSALRSTADARVSLIQAGIDPVTLKAPSGEETFVWLGDGQGGDVAAGGDLLVDPVEVLAAVATDRSIRSVEVQIVELKFDEEHGGEPDSDDRDRASNPDTDDDDRQDDDEGREIERLDMRAIGAEAAGPNGPIQILAGSDLGRVNSTVRTARNLLLIGIPLTLLAVAAVAWAALGRAFGPVEEIRREALDITGSRLDRRVPVQGTGDEIDRLAMTMNGMLDRLSEHDGRQKKFTSDASHELKTPIANVRAIVETSNPAIESWRVIRSRLVTEVDRLSALVDDLLFVSTRDERPERAQPKSVHIDDIVFDEAEALRNRSHLRVDISAVTPATVFGVSTELRRAIRNLATNAGRYAESVVAFEVAERGESVEINVCDDGPGIAPQDRATVLERFGRTDESRARAVGGTGLGLAIVAEIVSAHTGSISVGDAELGGAKVSLLLPTAPS